MERFHDSPVERALWRWGAGGIALAVLLTGFMGFLSWHSAGRAAADADWVAHTHAVETALAATAKDAVDVETGARGFAVTGEAVFLESYQEGQTDVGQDLETLRHLIANPAQQQRLNLLEQQINARIEISRRAVAEKQEKGAIPAKALFLEGKRRMDEVRATIAEMQSEESKLLDQRTARMQEARRTTRMITSAGTVLGVVLLLLAGFRVSRQINNSSRMRGQLKAFNADLEKCVEQRTAALQESQGQLEAIIQSAMDAIITVDEQQRIVLFNAAAEKMFRCSAAEAVGQSINRFIPQRFRAAHTAHVQHFGETGASKRSLGKLSELRALREDGEEFPMEASVSRTRVGTRQLFTVILRDVTERKRVEEQLARKAEESARSNKELEQFAYVASHDLQEPLRMVASYTQLLSERYRGKLDENADKYIGYAVEGALRMQALVQDLLAFSLAGRNGLEPKNTDCNAVVKEAIQNLRSAIEESGAVVTHGTLPAIAANRSQFLQILQNLIGNALKFRGKEPPAISVGAEKQGGEWQFSVTDNGIGIAPEHQEDVFVIFHRLHTRTEYAGNGIGLAICKKIIEHYGGKIWVESKVGSGCSFKFTLPAAAPEPAQETKR